jgi:hypothetical protein
MMKTIIAGSRTIDNIEDIITAVEQSGMVPSEVVCGGARGADALGKQYAEERNIPVVMFPADWNRYGKSAGYRRNVEMADYADGLIAVWDGESRGTYHMINIMRHMGKKVYVQFLSAQFTPPLVSPKLASERALIPKEWGMSE